MNEPLVLFGVESVFTPELLETARRGSVAVAACIVAGEPEWDMRDISPVDIHSIDASLLAMSFMVPWVTPGLRAQKTAEARRHGFHGLASLIDSSASVAATAEIAAGVYVNAGATVGAYVELCASALVNRSASIGHHTRLDPFVSVGPGATVAARCSIGSATMVGAGAVVAPGTTIGSNAVIAIGAVVARDVPSNCVVAGNPARIARSGIKGYRDVAV